MEFTGKGSGQRRVYVVDGEELEEVPDNEELDVMEADDEDADDAEDNVEVTEEDVVDGAIMENEDEDINDMASYVFTGHTDSVYCVAVHPTIPGLIATGNADRTSY